jgi:hypothetical protein
VNDGHPVSQPYSRAALMAKLTGAAVLATGALLVGQGTSQLATLPVATAGRILVAGASTPAWSDSGLSYSGGALSHIGAAGITSRQAASQDGVQLLGRAGGSSGWLAQITPATLTGNRVATLPDASIVIAGSAAALTAGRVPFGAAGGLLIDSSGLTYASNQLTVGTNVDGSALLRLNGAAASQRAIQMLTAGVARWIIDTDTVAESGANAGAALQFRSRDDAGNAIDTPLSIIRAAGGAITIARPVSISQNLAITSAGSTVYGWTYTPNDTASKIVFAVARGSGVTPAYINALSTGANDVSGLRFDVGGVVSATFTANGITTRDGTAVLPGLRLTSEASGLYRVSSTALGFAVAGAAAASLSVGSLTLTNPATAGQSNIGVINDSSYALYCVALGSTAASSTFGTARAGTCEIITTGTGNGLKIGNNTANQPIIFGGGTVEIARFSNSTLASGVFSVSYTTASTSTVTGAFTVAGGVGIGGALNIGAGFNSTISDAATNTQTANIVVSHNSSATPVAGFGAAYWMQAKTSTTNNTAQFRLTSEWVDPTHASRTARFKLEAWDSVGAREVMRGEANGSAALVGFLGAAAVARQTLGAAATDPATTQTLCNNLRTALINLGLGQT